MTTILDKHGEDKHREIDNAIKKLKFHVDELKSKHLVKIARR